MSNNIIKQPSKEIIKKNIIESGKVILEENDFFRELNLTMENMDFKIFYEKYFKNFSDIQTVILYMKLYETIKIEYLEKNGQEIEKEFLAYIMKELMSDDISRKNIINSFQNFSENKHNKKFILDIFDKKEIYNEKYNRIK